MSSFPSQDRVVGAIMSGITAAAQNFLLWTNGRLTLSYGPRKIISIHVAQEIALIENPPEVFIDATVADILKCSLPKRDSFVEYMQEHSLPQGTLSITLDERFEHISDDDSITRVIVSIRSGVINTKDEHIREIERLCKMLYAHVHGSFSLDYAVFAFYADISSGARKKLENRIPLIIQNFDRVIEKHKNLKSTFKGGDINKTTDGSEWCAGCYIIEPLT